MDWEKIKIEYITDPRTSYRSLASKYGVSMTQICNRSKAEGWIALRKQYLSDLETKTLDTLKDQQVAQMTKVKDTAYALLGKLQKAVDSVDSEQLVRNVKLARGLTGALRDIKELLDIKSEADTQEQQARIEKLRREIQKADDGGGNEITVRLMDGAEDYGA